jgi:quercetin dioxygenase-like cupin family protein
VAVDIGTVSGAVFWHVNEFPDAPSAEGVKGASSAVVHAYGRTFLETVNGDAQWRPSGGWHLATVGPMQAPQGEPVTVRFMQAMTEPDAMTRPHRHSGPEAFYVLSGSICLETPAGARTVDAGETLQAAAMVPMQLTSAGGGLRRSLFVVIHPSSQPWMTTAPDWMPKGACGRQL